MNFPQVNAKTIQALLLVFLMLVYVQNSDGMVRKWVWAFEDDRRSAYDEERSG